MDDTFNRLKSALADRYAIERELGSGGMATVYLAEDLKHHRKVAVKVLRSDLAAALGPERFLREIEIAARLTHPHILPLYDSGEADGFLFYVMPYVEGESLRERLNREKQLPLDDALQVAREVADALGSAHSHDVVHRDIKPENILLEEGHAVVADFGIARAITAAGGDRLTETGLSLGTPAYMSPEQGAGSQDVDGRSDIYSLGCVLYELLAGQPPFMGPTAGSIVHQHLTATPPPVTGVRPAVPSEVASALDRALEKTPADRYTTAAEFAEALVRAETASEEPRRAHAARNVAATALGVALFAAIGWWTFNTLSGGPGRIERLAVLPLANLMGNPEQEYFVQGMHDALIAELAQIGALTVISRQSVMRYKDTEKSVPEIARELNVQAVVEGSVFRWGDSVRIQAQLIEAVPEEGHLWARTYDRELRHVLALHSEVARDIAARVRVALTPEEEARLASARVVNPAAHEAHLKGRYHWNKRTEEGFASALQQFQHAIELDSGYALAYAGLADTYLLLGNYGVLPRSEAQPKAKAAALKALELDETLAEAHISLAGVKGEYEWDWSGAEKEFMRALELNPNYATGHQWYAAHLTLMGRPDEGVAEIKKAQELDPLSLRINVDVGRALYFAREYDQAIEQYWKTLELGPNFPSAHSLLGLAYLEKGLYEQAIAELQKGIALAGGGLSVWLGYAYAVAGMRREALEMLDKWNERWQLRRAGAPTIALIYAGLGEQDRALAWLEKAAAERDPGLGGLKAYPYWDSLRDDPRFPDLLRRVGLPQ